MSYKCVPQIIGLVRGKPAVTARHRANGLKILGELGEERFSRSETLDRSRSEHNSYDGYSSGVSCWNDMRQAADDYRITGVFGSGKRKGETFSRSLREDAVIGWSVIFKPPHDMTVDWNESTFQKFYEDSFSVLEELQPDLFRADNIRMKAKHRDEGVSQDDEHMHCVGDAIGRNGKYCGNLIDAALLSSICDNYPEKMRAKGWDIADCDRTDFSRLGKDAMGNYKDPEYRAEMLPKMGKRGRSVNKYIADKEKVLKEAQEASEAILSNAKRQAEEILQNAIKEAEKASKAILEKAREDSDRIRQFGDISNKIFQREADRIRKEQTKPLPTVYKKLKTDKRYQAAREILGDISENYEENQKSL